MTGKSNLSKAIASQAVDLATPTVIALMDSGVAKRHHLCIVVATRGIGPGNGHSYTVKASRKFGDPDEWENPYEEIALGKTAITARTGLSSRQVQLMQPELLLDYDVCYWGNTILGNIIVSCSGIQPWLDEAVSNTVAWLCRALIQERMDGLASAASGHSYAS